MLPNYTINTVVNNQFHEVINQFREAMRAAGIFYPGEILPDGKLHRIRSEDHKRGTANCAYVLHIDGGKPAGYFENWSTGTKQTWTTRKIIRNYHAFSEQINEAKLQRDVEQRQRHATAAIKAVRIWNQAKPITDQANHQYLTAKRIQPHGSRLYGDALVIRLINERIQTVNLQFIDADGTKRFLSGGRKKGCFTPIGQPTPRILIAEGFATAASIHEATGGICTIAAMDAGNLLPVARNIRELFKQAEITICGDNDISGIGQAKAREAALAVHGKIYIPPIEGCDWNDVLTGGKNA